MNKFAIKRKDQERATRSAAKVSTVPQLIDGGYATYWQMAERLGVSKDEAERRYRNAKGRGVWPIGWEDLRA